MKVIKNQGIEFGIQKDGNQYKVTKTIKKFNNHQDAQDAMLDLLRGRKTEDEIISGKRKIDPNLH
ncbi:hypothetical protein GH741_17665 [Aquibacillus halophilus]|uniref:Uncharacterized protein n=1 Tax=Aquibacillus halophilus TaxID=930132 RepID=A0A6A8DFI8_9BACI|nr:hypothetical protein [Aquibacillus halophilus]MRH44475.1 hypothetical protein [Aquibacillus halophilus]